MRVHESEVLRLYYVLNQTIFADYFAVILILIIFTSDPIAYVQVLDRSKLHSFRNLIRNSNLLILSTVFPV